jgi:hypothetical protein
VIAGVFDVIPCMGLIVSVAPAIIIALFTADILLSLGKIFLVFIRRAAPGRLVHRRPRSSSKPWDRIPSGLSWRFPWPGTSSGSWVCSLPFPWPSS